MVIVRAPISDAKTLWVKYEFEFRNHSTPVGKSRSPRYAIGASIKAGPTGYHDTAPPLGSNAIEGCERVLAGTIGVRSPHSPRAILTAVWSVMKESCVSRTGLKINAT